MLRKEKNSTNLFKILIVMPNVCSIVFKVFLAKEALNEDLNLFFF